MCLSVTVPNTSPSYTYPDRDAYEQDLRRRQEEHLRSIGQQKPWQPCMHDACPECVGTGLKRDGSACSHCISCPCPKCSPQ